MKFKDLFVTGKKNLYDTISDEQRRKRRSKKGNKGSVDVLMAGGKGTYK